jgi:type VI secretion system protein ImpG
MDPRLLRYYNQELAFLREMGAEFAQQFPKIAGRLGMEGLEVSDPYVERLLEGSAFLTARLQYKLDSEFERFTRRLLEIVYPNFLAPVPAMLVAKLEPDISDTNLARGMSVPRGTLLRGQIAAGETTACEFTTAHEVNLFPLQIIEASYFSYAPDLPLTRYRFSAAAKGGVRLKFQVGGGLSANQLQLDALNIYLSGAEETAYKLFEQSTSSFLGGFVLSSERPIQHLFPLPESSLQLHGYHDEQALLPASASVFQGYRLLQEYSAFPQRFLYWNIRELAAALSQINSSEFELVLLFGKPDAAMESLVDEGMFALFTTPAINLRKRRADRIHLSANTHEFQVLADRTRPVDFEIHSVDAVTGHGSGDNAEMEFLPLYSAFHHEATDHHAYFTVRREQRMLSQTAKRNGPRSSYIGSECFVAVVDSKEAPYPASLKQLSLSITTTNRDLPLFMPIGRGATDLTLEVSAPVKAIRCIRGPSRPFAPLAEGALAWKLVSHLSLNYLSLQDASPEQGAAALREMLRLYFAAGEAGAQRQLEGLRSVASRPSVRRLPMDGPLAFARGTEITLEVDDLAFQGGNAYLLGTVLERFLARHASANSFTETTLRSLQRGEIMRWLPRAGIRPIL